jgi:hypothetical protein
MFDELRQYVAGLSLPPGDDPGLAASDLRFSDGGMYKWEVAGSLSAADVEALVEALRAHGIQLNQVTLTPGIMRLLDDEIRDLVRVATDADVQLAMAAGPRGTYDIGAQ